MTLKIGYCAGHGYYTAGKRTPDDEREWTFNNKVVRAFEEEMKKYEGVELRRFDDPTGKTDVPLKDRTNGAKAWGADIYISFHHNALKAIWGNWTGIETFTYLGSQPKSDKLAACIHPEMVKAYGLYDRGIKKADLHIVRETCKTMASVLIEGGYMDSLIDIKKLRDDNVLKNAGIGVANGVAKYANLKLKPVLVEIAKEEKVTPKPSETKLEEVMSMKISDFINEGDMIRLETVYRYARVDKFLSDDSWEKKCKDKSITVGEVAYLDALLDHRRYGETKKKFAEYEAKIAELESKLNN